MNAGDPSSVSGLRRSAGEGIGYHSSVPGLPSWLSWWRIRLQWGRPRFDVGRSPGEGKGYPLQYSGLENSRDCIAHGVGRSQTGARVFSSNTVFTSWFLLASLLPSVLPLNFKAQFDSFVSVYMPFRVFSPSPCHFVYFLFWSIWTIKTIADCWS